MKTLMFRIHFPPILLFLLFFPAFVLISHGATLIWDTNSEVDLKGYKVYYGTSSGNYNSTIDVENITEYKLKFPSLKEGVIYYIAVTAYDTSGNESTLSTELDYIIEDGIPEDEDNCPDYLNGPDQGVCAKQINENLVIIKLYNCADDGDCKPGEFCERNQLDSNGNGIGDVCECESDFDCDRNQDWDDFYTFIGDWGRNPGNNPCPPCVPENESCEGDFDGDCDIDWYDVFKFLEDWGRNPDDRPCPACP